MPLRRRTRNPLRLVGHPPKKFSKLAYRNWPRNLLGWRSQAFSASGMLSAAGSEHAELPIGPRRSTLHMATAEYRRGYATQEVFTKGGTPLAFAHRLFASFASENFLGKTQNSGGQKSTLTSSSLGKRRVKKSVPNGRRKDFCGLLMGPPAAHAKAKVLKRAGSSRPRRASLAVMNR
jgi:hypothetical protein